MLLNYAFAALAGVTWYFQFFFYSMGQTKMGKYDFSSWTLHMASIMIFATIIGIFLKEWRGTSRRTGTGCRRAVVPGALDGGCGLWELYERREDSSQSASAALNPGDNGGTRTMCQR